MKKVILMVGTLTVAFLMISTVTAVPNTQSTPLMKAVDNIEKTKRMINNIESQNIADIQPAGFIDFLIQLLTLLINLIQEIIIIFQSVVSIITLIKAVIAAIQAVLDLIQQIIDLLNGGTPSYTAS